MPNAAFSGMRTKLIAIALVVALVSTTFGVSAFTTANMSRTSNINVVADNNGLIALEDGTDGSLISQNRTGALSIDLSNGSAEGANVHAHFEFGDVDDPGNHSAFNITNQDTTAHSFTFNYTASNADDDSDIEFRIFKESSLSSPAATVTDQTEPGGVTIDNVGSGATLHVVMVIDTEDDMEEDLSGSLEISA